MAGGARGSSDCAPLYFIADVTTLLPYLSMTFAVPELSEFMAAPFEPVHGNSSMG